MDAVVSGVGMLCSLGNNSQECLTSFYRGDSKSDIIKGIDDKYYDQKIAHEVSGDNSGEHQKVTHWLECVINEAVSQSKVCLDDKRVSVIVGTGMRELKRLELWWEKGDSLHIRDLHFGDPVKKIIGKAVPVYTFSNACSASNFALGLAQDMLTLDQADVVIVAGCDTISESMFAVANRLNSETFSELRSFERDRKGVLLGEGAAALVLEPNSHQVLRRNAKVLAKLLSVGMCCDAFHDTAPDMDGIVRSIVDSHTRAGIVKEKVDLLVTHGTGTALNDPTEAKAISHVFGDHCSTLLCTGIKGMTGHTSGAAGLMGVITAIDAINTSKVPAIVGLETPIVEASSLNLLKHKTQVDVEVAQVNAFGFGGVNAVVLLGANDEQC